MPSCSEDTKPTTQATSTIKLVETATDDNTGRTSVQAANFPPEPVKVA